MTVRFSDITQDDFLKHYWQKQPAVFRNAFTEFNHPISAEELAGLSLEEDIESRMVLETPNQSPQWHLKRGPFTEKTFQKLPKTHWTLLVQGVDRLIPEVNALLDQFNFIPQWRVDDVMISYAAMHGSVGPHFDHYDVFLYQAQGRREWLLTTQNCHVGNYTPDLDLRIMREFQVEQRIVLEEGDMLYLPPHVGHYGISLSDDCMTYSFGYRSYPARELLDSLSDFVLEQHAGSALYRDPDWSQLQSPAQITTESWQQARQALIELLHDDTLMKQWFGCFATRLDQQAEQQIALPLEEDERDSIEDFLQQLLQEDTILVRDPCCRFAYDANDEFTLFINGCEWESQANPELLKRVADHRILTQDLFGGFLSQAANIQFLYDLWVLQWLQFQHEEEVE